MSDALLDSHVLLWALFEPRKLSRRLIEAIEAAPVCRVSAASIWEIGIKRAPVKLDVPTDMAARVRAVGFPTLSITAEHAELAAALPRHHEDPFDRLLVAQARVEGLAPVTADRRLAACGVEVL